MVVSFSKQYSNYTHENLYNLLWSIPDDRIHSLVIHPVDYIKVIGDIHRSQWTSDNPSGHYWFKIKAYENGFNVPDLNSVHIYVCFREYSLNKRTKVYVPKKCINPPTKTNVADVRGLFGVWEYVKMTKSHQAAVPRTPRTPKRIKRKSVSARTAEIKKEMMEKFSRES